MSLRLRGETDAGEMGEEVEHTHTQLPVIVMGALLHSPKHVHTCTHASSLLD